MTSKEKGSVGMRCANSVAGPNVAVCSLALRLGDPLVHVCSKQSGYGGEDRKYVAAHKALAYGEEVPDDESGEPIAHRTEALGCGGVLWVG